MTGETRLRRTFWPALARSRLSGIPRQTTDSALQGPSSGSGQHGKPGSDQTRHRAATAALFLPSASGPAFLMGHSRLTEVFAAQSLFHLSIKLSTERHSGQLPEACQPSAAKEHLSHCFIRKYVRCWLVASLEKMTASRFDKFTRTCPRKVIHRKLP